MGLSNTSAGNTTIVTIVHGKFTVRLADDDPNPDAIERALTKGDNMGKLVKELQYTSIDGHIVGGEIFKGNWGVSLNLKLHDGEHGFILQVPVKSSEFSQVVKRMPNINTNESVTFIMGIDKKRKRPFMYLKQETGNVPMHYTKDKPNGLPPAVEVEEMGTTKWDFREQENFLYGVANDFCNGLPSAADLPEKPDYDPLMDDKPPVPAEAPADLGADGTPDEESMPF